MKGRLGFCVVLALVSTLATAMEIFEVHEAADFQKRLDRYKNRNFHSRWILFEAKWCPYSKNGIVSLKQTFRTLKKDIVLFRVDW